MILTTTSAHSFARKCLPLRNKNNLTYDIWQHKWIVANAMNTHKQFCNIGVQQLCSGFCYYTFRQAAVCAYQPDNYERLVKGLIGYNTGASAPRLLNCSLAEMLAGGV